MSDQQTGVSDERRKAWGDKYRPRYSGVATFMRRPLLEEAEQLLVPRLVGGDDK